MSAVIRSLTAGDLPAVAAVGAAAFGFGISTPQEMERWDERIAHPFVTDPHGGIVAERDGRIVGAAQVLIRERLWVLSLLVVDPDGQNIGAGRQLLAAALRHGARETDAGLIVSSNDPRALRLYARFGFKLAPAFEAEGTIDRRALPREAAGVRMGGDLEALADVSREIRGAPHTAELEFAVRRGAVLLHLGERGFVVAMGGHAVWLLAARDEEAARALLWAALEHAGDSERPLIRWLTGDQGWAIDVAVRAGLALRAYGAVCVRGRPGPLAPFIPSAAFA